MVVFLLSFALIAGDAAGQATDAAAGAALFQRSCASCHNVEGRAPALSTGVFAHGGEDAQIAQTIRTGVPGTQMPPFPALSPEAIAQLIAYIRSISPSTPRPAAAPTAVAPAPNLTFDRLRHASSEPQNWLTYWGDYQGTHYSAPRAVSTANVAPATGRVGEAVPGDSILEATPLVVDGVMYTSGAPPASSRRSTRDRPADLAISARAEGPQPERDQPLQPRRGDPREPAVRRHARRGAARARCAHRRAALGSADGGYDAGLQHHQPAAAVKDKIITGIAGGEFGDPRVHRCLRSGDRQAPVALLHDSRPGEFGHDTWKGDSWKNGGGGDVAARTYDPDLDTLYWAAGNPCPLYNGSVRAKATTCSPVRWSRSIRRPAAASGTTSSRRTTRTTGTRTRTWCWSIAMSAANRASC